MKIKFVFKGLAISYFKNDGENNAPVWRIIFPTDNDHKLNFSFQKVKNGEISNENASPPISLAGAENEIAVETQGAVVPSSPSTEDFNEFIDMTATYSHTSGMKLKDGWQKSGVLMKIPNITLFMEKASLKEFLLTPKNLPVGVDLGTVGEVAGGEIILNDGGQIVLKLNKKEIVPPFKDEKDTTFTLIFDNDCAVDGNGGKDDFPQYYNLLEDVTDARRQFDTQIKVEKTVVIESMTNPMILCCVVRISKPNTSFP